MLRASALTATPGASYGCVVVTLITFLALLSAITCSPLLIVEAVQAKSGQIAEQRTCNLLPFSVPWLAAVLHTSMVLRRLTSESWWSFFRRSRSQWWIELFESLVAAGVFKPGHAHQTDCMRFSFMSLVQEDLNFVRQLWNTHRIRSSHYATCPPGIPDELYFIPIPPAVDCLLHVPTRDTV